MQVSDLFFGGEAEGFIGGGGNESSRGLGIKKDHSINAGNGLF